MTCHLQHLDAFHVLLVHLCHLLLDPSRFFVDVPYGCRGFCFGVRAEEGDWVDLGRIAVWSGDGSNCKEEVVKEVLESMLI